MKNGKLVIVVDDEDRENEGDFLTAARNVTPEMVNFMEQIRPRINMHSPDRRPL